MFVQNGCIISSQTVTFNHKFFSLQETIPDDIYPFKVVDDQTRGIVGSCSMYYDRRDITFKARQATLEEATRR